MSILPCKNCTSADDHEMYMYIYDVLVDLVILVGIRINSRMIVSRQERMSIYTCLCYDKAGWRGKDAQGCTSVPHRGCRTELWASGPIPPAQVLGGPPSRLPSSLRLPARLPGSCMASLCCAPAGLAWLALPCFARCRCRPSARLAVACPGVCPLRFWHHFGFLPVV